MDDFFTTHVGLRRGTSAECQSGPAYYGPSAVTMVALNLLGAPAWVIAATQKLERLAMLPSGWDSYGGRPLKQSARESTLKAISWLQQEELPIPAVVLGSKGTVQLEWHSGSKELDVDLGEGEDIGFVKCDDEGEPLEGRTGQGAEELRRLTRWLVTR